jgi:hypothetical protein
LIPKKCKNLPTREREKKEKKKEKRKKKVVTFV